MSLSPAGRRAKGHSFERLVANDFQELGFDCMTTRAAKGGNWCATDHGIDLFGTDPFLVQCKRKQTYSHISAIEEIELEDGKIPLLLSKADNKPTMAVLPWEELKKLIRENYRRAA